MYRPPAFAVDDPEVLVEVMRSAGFGHLVVLGPDGLTSAPLPFVVSDDGTRVTAHVARNNPIWRCAPCGALLIIPSVGAYVSPSWYPSKQVDGRVVPTWNYEVVNARGTLMAHDDPDWVAGQVRDLTEVNEAGFEEPWSVDDAPSGYVTQKMRGVVGLELLVDQLVGKRKMSQNRPESDVAGAVDGLRGNGARGAAVADLMTELASGSEPGS